MALYRFTSGKLVESQVSKKEEEKRREKNWQKKAIDVLAFLSSRITLPKSEILQKTNLIYCQTIGCRFYNFGLSDIWQNEYRHDYNVRCLE